MLCSAQFNLAGSRKKKALVRRLLIGGPMFVTLDKRLMYHGMINNFTIVLEVSAKERYLYNVLKPW